MDFSGLKPWLAAATLAAATALPAHANVVTFNNTDPILFSNDSILVEGLRFTSDGFGFSGVDTPAAFSAFGNAPGNAVDSFLFMLNSDGMIVESADAAPLRILGFDTSFIAPFGGIGANVLAGQLYVFGQGATPQDFDFEIFDFDPSDANGDFNFQTITLDRLSNRSWNSYAFFSCVYDANFVCQFSGQQLQPQFALDNIRVPEPGSMALIAAAMLAAGIGRRRQHA